jgi:hypothetical protein
MPAPRKVSPAEHGAGLPRQGGEQGQAGEQGEGLPGNLRVGVAAADNARHDLHAGARLEARGALADFLAIGVAQIHFSTRPSASRRGEG